MRPAAKTPAARRRLRFAVFFSTCATASAMDCWNQGLKKNIIKKISPTWKIRFFFIRNSKNFVLGTARIIVATLKRTVHEAIQSAGTSFTHPNCVVRISVATKRALAADLDARRTILRVWNCFQADFSLVGICRCRGSCLGVLNKTFWIHKEHFRSPILDFQRRFLITFRQNSFRNPKFRSKFQFFFSQNNSKISF